MCGQDIGGVEILDIEAWELGVWESEGVNVWKCGGVGDGLAMPNMTLKLKLYNSDYVIVCTLLKINIWLFIHCFSNTRNTYLCYQFSSSNYCK